MPAATYVYCLVASPRRPRLTRVPDGLRGMGPARLLDVSMPRSRRWLVVADAPTARYGEDAITKGLPDLSWVSRAAVAHEAVVEAFLTAPALLPMKLFTIFASDERARAHMVRDHARIDRLVGRVRNCREWGVRVTFERGRAAPSAVLRRGSRSGAGYLADKKTRRDASSELSLRARATVSDLSGELETLAADVRRRDPSELRLPAGPLLLDSAYLIARSRERRFVRLVRERARSLAGSGYRVLLSGPWPPYAFVGE